MIKWKVHQTMVFQNQSSDLLGATLDMDESSVKDKNYPESLVKFSGKILLVGISYDKKTKVHQCMIEEFEK
ncbi:MAG: hypothetical protein SOZ59_00240 [Candidatus Limivivens sp.]|nr:hypothetical protein [Candidatus Limivivens sp.]